MINKIQNIYAALVFYPLLTASLATQFLHRISNFRNENELTFLGKNEKPVEKWVPKLDLILHTLTYLKQGPGN